MNVSMLGLEQSAKHCVPASLLSMSQLSGPLQVQGVFFRSSTVDEAKKLGVVGWVQNTSAGTVQGQVQGKQEATEKMKVSEHHLMHSQHCGLCTASSLLGLNKHSRAISYS